MLPPSLFLLLLGLKCLTELFLCPLGYCISIKSGQNIAAFKTGMLPGKQTGAEAGRASAVRGSAKPAGTQIKLSGGKLVFWLQNLRLNDNYLLMKVVSMRYQAALIRAQAFLLVIGFVVHHCCVLSG